MLILWAWPPLRFLSVLAPLGIAWFWVGFKSITLLQAFPTRLALGLGLVCTMSSALFTQVGETVTFGAPTLPGVRQLHWQEFSIAMNMVSDATPHSAIILSNLDPTVYLYTGREAIRGFQSNPYQLIYASVPTHPLGDSSQLIRTICTSGVTHLLLTPDGGFAETPHLRALVEQLRLSNPRALKDTFDRSGGYRLIPVHRSELCQTLLKDARLPSVSSHRLASPLSVQSP
jgi:hypothetical protein